ncbi:RNA binding protein containing a single S4 domain [Clostridium aceticum]|uniref:RNA binding protein containing a single S4 domain n=1 Tax=Clostridium aceticum TaxID=84022 RepID=A0A0D8I7Y7_9CLOT|nr:RNA-binding S4 domain-containing protein [Clostridium aceticum]AKL93529.1 RNA binding protein containing a single S4 domain [Clostridium aceticum]KJF26385.1 RNA-binding protein S4 [Clostridium aceticum]
MLREFKLEGEYIKLDQLLKSTDIVGSGGHAKIIILNEEVKVNGEIVTQRGKKIKLGDLVEVEGIKIKVI